MKHPPPSPPAPCGGIPRHHSGERNLDDLTRIVIHSAVMDCKPGAARLLAKWCAEGTTMGSWHYGVDPDETTQCAWDRFVCWHAPPNGGSLGIEMADRPALGATGMARWALPRQRRMLKRAAELTAELCLAYDIPAVLLTPAGLKEGRRGIATHNSVSDAFHQSTHWDPGAWPRTRFMRMVRDHITHLEESRK